MCASLLTTSFVSNITNYIREVHYKSKLLNQNLSFHALTWIISRNETKINFTGVHHNEIGHFLMECY